MHDTISIVHGAPNHILILGAHIIQMTRRQRSSGSWTTDHEGSNSQNQYSPDAQLIGKTVHISSILH